MASKVVHEPYGVVGCVTPWNYPLMQAVIKVAPALAAGCTVVLKPSPLASLTCLMLGELAVACDLPAGALNVLSGGPPGPPDAAQHFAEHPDLDKLSFTGSGATGKALLHASANALRPTSLELGGKGAMIVFDDADLDGALDWAMIGIFLTTGQVRGNGHASIAAAGTAQAGHATSPQLHGRNPVLVVGAPCARFSEETFFLAHDNPRPQACGIMCAQNENQNL